MSVIDELLAKSEPADRKALERIRQLIHKVAPDAEEVMTYAMPGFKYKGKYLVAFAAFKDHLSLFPGAGAIAHFQDELADFTTSKGTIQFTLDHPLPDDLVRRIIRQRISEIEKKA